MAISRTYLGAGASQTISNASDEVEVFGAAGATTEYFMVGTGNVNKLIAQSSIEKVLLSGNITSYTYEQIGASVNVKDADDAIVVTIYAQSDADGTKLVCADGSVDITFGTGANAQKIYVGGFALTDGSEVSIVPTTIGDETSGEETAAGDVFDLSVGQDNLPGTTGDDTFTARVGQNGNGEQTNQLATGDRIDGLGGDDNDTLNAIVQMASPLNDGPGQAIMPETTDVENVVFTAISTGGASEEVNINAKYMYGLDLVSSKQSDASLLIENLTTLEDDGATARETSAITIRMDHSGNEESVDVESDMTVLFDNDYLLTVPEDTSVLELRMVNCYSLAEGDSPLVGFTVVSFQVGDEEVVVDIDGLETYEDVAGAIETELTSMNITGVVVTLLADRKAYFSDDVGVYSNRQEAGDYTPILLTSSAHTLARGETTTDNTTLNANFLNTQTTESSSEILPVTSMIELFKVGRGAEGGNLTVGGMSGDLDNVFDYSDSAIEEGVEKFIVTVEGNSSQFSDLASLQSTNNTLAEVEVSWAAASEADLIIGNHNTVNTWSGLANSANSSAADGILDVTTTMNNALKDVRVFTAENASTVDVTLSAHISDETVAKYMDRADNDPDPVFDNADFAYTFGAGNDTLNLNISKANLAASGTTNREDFTMSIATNAGDDTVVTQIGDGSGAATDAWYINSKNEGNLTIETAAGADTIHTNGAGIWDIDAGAGDDVVYSDNSGTQAYDDDNAGEGVTFNSGRGTWVFNTSLQTQASAIAQQNIDNLETAASVTAVSDVANLSLTINYLGLEATVIVGGTDDAEGGTVSDLEINQAIKDAISGDVFLNKLLVAEDGPGHTLIVRSLTDGVMTDDDITISLSTDALTDIQDTNNAAELTDAQANALGFEDFDVDGVATQTVAGRFDSALADQFDTTAALAQITGRDSVAATASTIVDGTGDDVIVLSTSGLDMETVDLTDDSATFDDVIFNATEALVYNATDATIITSDGVLVEDGSDVIQFISGTGTMDADAEAAYGVGAISIITGNASANTIYANALGSTITGLAGADTIYAGDGVDNVIITTGLTADTVEDMTLGAGNDQIRFDLSALVTAGAVEAAITVDYVELQDASTVVGADAAVIQEVADQVGGVAVAAGANANVFVLLTETYATLAALETGLETGDHELTVAAGNAVNDSFIVVWSDGTDSHVSSVRIAVDSGADFAAADLVATDLVTIVGTGAIVAGEFHINNFDFVV